MTALLLLPLTELEAAVFVAVAKRVFPNAAVTDTFPNRTAISDGILPETVGIMDMIYICWLHPILKATFLFFLY